MLSESPNKISPIKQKCQKQNVEQQFDDIHFNSSLLPKIRHTTALAKTKIKIINQNNHNTNDNDSNAHHLNYSLNVSHKDKYKDRDREKDRDRDRKMDDERNGDDHAYMDKKKKMPIIIHDYLENFRTRQKGIVLAFSSQFEKFQQKPIKVEGISHQKFLGKQVNDGQEKNKRMYSLQARKRFRIKTNLSFLQKIKNQHKIHKAKNPNSHSKLRTEPDGSNKIANTDSNPSLSSNLSSNLNSNQNLSGYILKAKKSILDIRENSKEKAQRYKKSSQIGPYEN